MKRTKTFVLLAILAVILSPAAFAQEAFSDIPAQEADSDAPVQESVSNAPLQDAVPNAPSHDAVLDVSVREANSNASAQAGQGAEAGFRVKVDVDTNFVTWYHQDVRNDTYVVEAIMPQEDSVYFMRNPDYGDVEFDMTYTDPLERFGGKLAFRFGGSYFDEKGIQHYTWLPYMDDVSGWVKVTPFFRGKLGKFTERVVEKIGGDKDLGVLLFGIGEAGGKTDLVINTSDSLGLGSNTIGFLPAAIIPGKEFGLPQIGELQLSGFFAPNEYLLGQRLVESDPYNSNPAIIIPGYSIYKFGGSAKYSYPEWGSLGFAMRTSHTESETGFDYGKVQVDWGLYGIITSPFVPGLKLGFGYSRHLDYWDEKGEPVEVRKPWKGAWHIDVSWTGISYGGISNRLTVGLFNNISSHFLAKEDTYNYVEKIDKANPDIYGDESSLVVYNELNVGYQIFDFLQATLMIRNYYATLANNEGIMGQDYGKENFIVELLGRYTVTDKVQFRTGVKFEMNNYGTPVNSDVLQNSNHGVSIPVGITVVW